MSTISLRCNDCDGFMEVDESREVLSCPYCGSKSLIIESDRVKIERIKYRTYKDVVFGKIKYARQAKFDEAFLEKERQKENWEYTKKGLAMIAGIAIFVLVICALASYLNI